MSPSWCLKTFWWNWQSSWKLAEWESCMKFPLGNATWSFSDSTEADTLGKTESPRAQSWLLARSMWLTAQLVWLPPSCLPSPPHTSPVNPPWVIPFQVCLLFPDWTLPNTVKNLEVRERTVQRIWDETVLGIVKEQGPGAGVSKEGRDRRWNQGAHREEEQMEKHFWNLGFYSASGGSHWRTLSRGVTGSNLHGTERTLECKETEGVRVVAGRAVRRSQQ